MLHQEQEAYYCNAIILIDHIVERPQSSLMLAIIADEWWF